MCTKRYVFAKNGDELAKHELDAARQSMEKNHKDPAGKKKSGTAGREFSGTRKGAKLNNTFAKLTLFIERFQWM